MVSCTVFTDQVLPGGRLLRYNIDKSSDTVAADVCGALRADGLLRIENEDGGDPIFLNPERIVSITPAKGEDQ